jgi:hypothetical protein
MSAQRYASKHLWDADKLSAYLVPRYAPPDAYGNHSNQGTLASHLLGCQKKSFRSQCSDVS